MVVRSRDGSVASFPVVQVGCCRRAVLCCCRVGTAAEGRSICPHAAVCSTRCGRHARRPRRHHPRVCRAPSPRPDHPQGQHLRDHRDACACACGRAAPRAGGGGAGHLRTGGWAGTVGRGLWGVRPGSVGLYVLSGHSSCSTVPSTCVLSRPAHPHPACSTRHVNPAHTAGAGVFGVETFLLADGSVLLNEVAPRPHNSGHYTSEASPSSQFEVRGAAQAVDRHGTPPPSSAFELVRPHRPPLVCMPVHLCACRVQTTHLALA